MGKRMYLLLVVLTIVSGFMGGLVASRIFAAKSAVAQETGLLSATMSPGKRPYIPTRMEWLDLYLNANYGYYFSENHFGLRFVRPADKPETIRITCYYLPMADSRIVYGTLAYTRKRTREVVKSYGWDSWVRIEQHVKMADFRNQSR